VNLSEAATAYREMAEHCEESLALDCAKAGSKEYLAGLDVTTPVLSGALRRSEHVDAVFGSGTHATAVVAPHIIYGRFRNDGGTITAKGPWPLRNAATGQVFSRPGGSVTQAGSHYMERAEDEVRGTMPAAMQIILAEYLTL
jgi:hypothetical protein